MAKVNQGRQTRFTLSASLFAMCCASLTAPAFAQQAEDASRSADGSTEIIVTAQKREERLQDVPIAITAIGQAEISDRGSRDIKDLQYSVPGLNIQELQPGANRTMLRGINPGSTDGLPIVGVYVDEVGITLDLQQREGAFPLVDLERIEVLRGPQGTLYGQGSIAGTIRYLTRNPSLTAADGFVEANIYQQEKGSVGYRINGAVGVPLVTDKVGLRVAMGYDHLAGWIDYPDAGIKNANDTSRVFIRPKLLARLSDDVTLTLLYQYYKQSADTDWVSSVADPASRPGRTRLYPARDESHLANAILSWDLGPATLTASTGYQHRDIHLTSAIATFFADLPSTYKQFSQEVRLSSNGSGPFRYTVGGWYRNFDSFIDRILFLNGVETAIARGRGTDPVNAKSAAIFADGTYDIGSKVELSLGGRYYWDTRHKETSIPVLDLKDKFDAFSPRVSVRYKWSDDASTYATVSKGFRSGGFNVTGSTYGPESLWNYEIGTKASFLDGALFIDVAGYYLDYKDRQLNSLVETAPGVFLGETRSTGKASGFGIEGAISARLGSGFTLEATGAYNDITSDRDSAEIFKGERFGFVPAFTGSVALSQRVPVSANLTGMWRVDYLHSSPYRAISRTPQADGSVVTTQNYRNQNQDYLNLRIGVETERLGAYLDVQNLLNEDAVLFPFTPIATTQEGTRARPRSYGLTVRAQF